VGDLEIRVDHDRCRGAGECVSRAPGTFTLNDDNRSIVIDPAGDDLATVRIAASSCPHFAITLER